MPAHYTKERAKYGSGTGSIITWPVELTTKDPLAESNVKYLPAGYLKCDGTIYKAEDYPQLAEILGVGAASKFIRYDINNDPIDDVDDDEFIVPDLGSKYPKPTTGAAAGTYINIVTEDQAGNEKRRSGMGITATATAGTTTGNTTVIQLSYVGTFTVPSQEIALKGKPSWTKGTNNSGFTDVESVDSLALHSHMHFSTTNRLRLKTTNETSGPQAQGVGSYFNATTVPIQDWLNNQRYNNSSSNPPGTNQPACWAIASGVAAGGYQQIEVYTGIEVAYYNMCFDLKSPGGLNTLRYNCLLTSGTSFNLNNIVFGTEPSFHSHTQAFCITTDGPGGISKTETTPATYTSATAPTDWKGTTLADVLPLNSNTATKTGQAYPQVNNVVTEISELSQPDGDPTVHSHKILLEVGTHSYKIKTAPLLLSPDNLVTTLTLQTDQVASLDQITSPYIIMEYLIKY